MFDWVDLPNYGNYFHILVFVMVLIALWQCHTGTILKNDVATMNATWGCIIAVFLILYIGLRPIGRGMGDTINYASQWNDYVHLKEPFKWEWKGDWLFYNIMHLFTKFTDIHTFFLLNAILYVGSLWLACARIFKNYYYIAFLVILGMFTFWAYGVNGVRNGVGASLFILAMTYVNNIPVMAFFAIIATGFHNSVYLMIAAAGLAWFIKNSYYYLVGWICCVGVSYALGARIQSYLTTLSFIGEDERFTGYLTGNNMVGEIVQMSMTFRWDFLLYSAIGVAVGYYFIFRKNYKDEYYHWIYNTYLATNAFWVLVIRAAYSNRFAQISWFILPLVLVYPFMKKRFWVNHEKMLAGAILVFYAYGFYTNIISTNALTRVFAF